MHLDFSWRDAGLVPRLLNNAAVNQGMDPDAYVTLLRRTWSPAGSPPDSIGSQLAGYIANPAAGPLTAMLAPEKPIPFMALAALSDVVTHPHLAESLGLTVQAPVSATGNDTHTPDPNMTTDEPVDPEVLAPGASVAPKTSAPTLPAQKH